jgi:hypothetical protein
MLTRSNPVEVRAERQLRPTNKGGAALPRSRDLRTKGAFPTKSFRTLLQGSPTFNHTRIIRRRKDSLEPRGEIGYSR